jgi:hypothetical protein
MSWGRTKVKLFSRSCEAVIIEAITIDGSIAE